MRFTPQGLEQQEVVRFHDESDLTIVLLGHTGSGKSASANTILGRAAFVSKASFKPVTTEICEITGEAFGKRIKVIDTPGILQSKETEEQIKTRCQQVLKSSRTSLFLVVVSVTRFTHEQEQAVRTTLTLLGKEGLKNSFMLFTSGDALKKSVDNFIFEDEEGSLPEIVKELPGRHLFNNEDERREQVKELLIKTGHLQSERGSDPAVNRSDGFDWPEEIRIVLTGLPESGKSSSGNTILGSNMFKPGPRFGADSTERRRGSAHVGGRLVMVVDTEGFTDDVQNPQQLYDVITSSMDRTGPGPHALVIVVKIGRVSKAESVLLQMLSSLLSDGAHEYSMVLFTHGDELKGQSIDDMIWSDGAVSQLVGACHHRFCVFDNRGRESRRQVQNFMGKICDVVRANGGRPCPPDMFHRPETRVRAAELTVPQRFRKMICEACCSWCCRPSSRSEEEEGLLESGHYQTYAGQDGSIN